MLEVIAPSIGYLVIGAVIGFIIVVTSQLIRLMACVIWYCVVSIYRERVVYPRMVKGLAAIHKQIQIDSIRRS